MEFSNDIEISNNCNDNESSFAKPERYTINKGADLVGGTSSDNKVYYKVKNFELFKVSLGNAVDVTDVEIKLDGDDDEKETDDGFFKSKIISTDDKESFVKLISKELNRELYIERVYCGSKDTFEASTFHKKTDDVAERVFVFKNEFDVVFGGYVSKSLNSVNDKWINDPTAFLFKYTPEITIFKPKEATGYHAFYKNKTKICEFSNDIEISDKCNENKDSFSKPERFKFTKGKDLIGGESDEPKAYCKITEFELFKVNFGKKVVIDFESNIFGKKAKTEFVDQLTNVLNTGFEIKRVYAGSIDGFQAKKFHKMTDHVSKRVIVIKNEFDVVFGGYVSIALNDATGKGKWVNDPNAFLFQCTPASKIFPLRQADGFHAFYNNKTKICEFSSDIEISNNCHVNKSSFAKPKSYSFGKGNELVGSANDTQKVNFKVKDIEVFEIEFKDNTIEVGGTGATLTTNLFTTYNIESFIVQMQRKLERIITLERVYSGLKDGFSPANFHKKTDMIKERLIVIKNEFDVVFGGYVTVALNDANDKWIDDKHAFLFQFTPSMKVFPITDDDGKQAYYKSDDKLIEFNDDIEIFGNCNQNSLSFSSPKVYKFENGQDLVGSQNTNKKVFFKVKDFEVFKVNLGEEKEYADDEGETPLFDSRIIMKKKPFMAMLKKKLKDNVALSRVYTGFDDGFKASTFHSKTDEVGSRAIIVKTEFNTIFGGYVSKSVNSCVTADKWINDPKAFLFQLKPLLKTFDIKQTDGFHAFYAKRDKMVEFSDDVDISDNCNENNESFVKPLRYKFTKAKDVIGCESDDIKVNFKVKDIEVFSIKKVTLDSKILAADQEIKFLEMVSGHLAKKVTLKKVYDASIHGFKASKFHTMTDMIADRILIVKTVESGAIFGGYVTKSCNDIADKWWDDPNAFVYQFHPNKKVYKTKQDDGHHAFYKNLSKFMEFSNDIEISDNCNANKASFCKPERYTIETGSDLCGGTSTDKKVYYTVEGLELYQVFFGENIDVSELKSGDDDDDDEDEDALPIDGGVPS